MKTKHTPGPWHTDDTKSFYVFAEGNLLEQAGVKNGPFVANASTASNAALIAAAPELYVMLCETRDALINECHGKQLTPWIQSVITRSGKVIDKAEGRDGHE